MAFQFVGSAQKSKRMNTLEYYHIHYSHQNNMIIKEQNQQEKNPLFELTQGIQGVTGGTDQTSGGCSLC